MKKNILLLAILAATATIYANEVKLEKIEDFQGNRKVLKQIDENIIEVNGVGVFSSVESIDFDKNSKYYVSGDFKNIFGKGKLYFGFYPVDKNGRNISMINVDVIKNTDTEVVEDALAGTKIIKVKDATNWSTNSNGIAYGTKDDYSDLPNFNIIHNTIVSTKKSADGTWEVTLKQPLKTDLLASEKVRLHKSGGNMYSAARSIVLNSEWENFSGFALDLLKNPGISQNIFPIGTEKVRILLYCNLTDPKGVIQMKNIVLEKE